MTDLGGESMVVAPGEGEPIWFMGSLVEIKAAAEQTGGSYGLVVVTAPPEVVPSPPHRHADKDEAFYVLEGTLNVVLGEQTLAAREGTFVHIPRGMVHGFWNPSDVPARLLAIFHPGGFERFFAALGEPARTRTLPPPPGPPDVPRLLAVAREFHTEIIGGPPS